MILPRRIPKAPKRSSRWRSTAHCNFVRSHACCNCGSTTNVVVAHVRLGSGAGLSQKPSDWRTVSLCDGPFANIDGMLGCHNTQHTIGEDTFWQRYQKDHGCTVEELIDAFCKASPKAAEIRKVRENA